MDGFILLAIMALIAILLFAPREPINLFYDEPSLPSDITELDAWLETKNNAQPGIVPGAEEHIEWHNDLRQKTPISMLYLHGFSASRQEVSPVPEHTAQQLGANVFFARLTGHGCGPDALGQATINDWLSDAILALRMAEALGDQVVIISSSTGTALAHWMLQHAKKPVLANIMISPNFKLLNKGVEFFLGPWGERLMQKVLGKDRIPGEDLSGHPDRERLWTRSYPTRALLPMLAATRIARRISAHRIATPALLIYSPLDQVVDTKVTDKIFDSLGSDIKDTLILETQHDPRSHLITGDIMAPQNSAKTVAKIIEFVNRAAAP